MADLVPEYLTFDYHCQFRGAPGASHDPEDYPVFWTVKVKAMTWEDDNDNDGQEVANVGEMLTINRPDLIEDMALGGDLLVLSSLRISPKFRGNKLGHTILKAILCTVGRSTSKVILQAAPVLTKKTPAEGSVEHDLAKAALRHYWESFGFQPAHGDYLVFEDMADVLD